MLFLAYLVNLVSILSAGTLVWALSQRLADGGGIARSEFCIRGICIICNHPHSNWPYIRVVPIRWY